MLRADPLAIVAEARRRGIELTRGEGDRVVWRGPPGALDDELAQHLRAHRADVLALVAMGCSRCGTTETRLVTAYWGTPYCPDCAAALAQSFDEAGSWPPAFEDLPTGPPADSAAVENAARVLAETFAAQSGTPYACQSCGRTVDPGTPTLERRWSTICGQCWARATDKDTKEPDDGA